jgi:hypothetical protein
VENLFSKTRVAEMASYGQIAYERVRVIGKLKRLILETQKEDEFQDLLADATWLIEPTWSVITTNQTLATVRDQLQHWLKTQKQLIATFAIRNERKRPDFTLADIGRRLHIVEIKASGHKFDNNDFKRLTNYVDAFDSFFAAHETVRSEFSQGYLITVVADGVNITDFGYRDAFASYQEKGKVRTSTWTDLLIRTENAHQQFLNQIKPDVTN